MIKATTMKQGPILLIDDDPDEWDFMKDTLRSLKIENPLRCFTDGRPALDYLRTTTEMPFIIISDVNMPGMNGLELRRQIFEDAALRKKNIPFVFLTTAATIQTVSDAYQLSVQGFFEKPQTIQDIESLTKQIFNYWQVCRHPSS